MQSISRCPKESRVPGQGFMCPQTRATVSSFQYKYVCATCYKAHIVAAETFCLCN